jgi:TctA family transporter
MACSQLGPMVKGNFLRPLKLSRGNLSAFIERPISATFIAISLLVVLARRRIEPPGPDRDRAVRSLQWAVPAFTAASISSRGTLA